MLLKTSVCKFDSSHRVLDMQHTESMGIVEDVIFQISYSDSLISHFHNEALSNRSIFIINLYVIGIPPLSCSLSRMNSYSAIERMLHFCIFWSKS